MLLMTLLLWYIEDIEQAMFAPLVTGTFAFLLMVMAVVTLYQRQSGRAIRPRLSSLASALI